MSRFDPLSVRLMGDAARQEGEGAGENPYMGMGRYYGEQAELLKPALTVNDLDRMVAAKVGQLERQHEAALVDAQRDAWEGGRQVGYRRGFAAGEEQAIDRVRSATLMKVDTLVNRMLSWVNDEARSTIKKEREILMDYALEVTKLGLHIRQATGERIPESDG